MATTAVKLRASHSTTRAAVLLPSELSNILYGSQHYFSTAVKRSRIAAASPAKFFLLSAMQHSSARSSILAWPQFILFVGSHAIPKISLDLRGVPFHSLRISAGFTPL